MTRISSILTLLLLVAVGLHGSFALADDSETSQGLAQQATRLMEKRCMVCHGCYDAPCQLKLEAGVGLHRGANKARVYEGSRLVAAQMTRLFDDGFTAEQWKKKGFTPVINQKDPEQGVLYRMLELKKDNPLPNDSEIYDKFDFSLNRDQQCPKPDEFDEYAEDYPLWGMPYGFPGLRPDEHQLMIEWLESGAPTPAPTPLSKSQQTLVRQWETFLNGDSNKEKLMSRYLYEHLFLANLYLEDSADPAWFRMVRSHTPPGRNIGLIATRRPYDNPGTGKFYYRLQRMPVSILDKRHMPYRFDAARMDWYKGLFLTAPYEVAKLPDFSPDIVTNPFKRFRAIPVKSRYEFLLEEAQFSIMNFIKGPVCRGQIALSVIDDHFWVMFVAPAASEPEQDAGFLAREADNLRLPTVSTGTPVDLLSWRRYAKAEQAYAAAKAKFMAEELSSAERRLGYDDIWDGDGRNANATLTVFRHFDTASVVKGFVGDIPKTAWVISYPLLERIHYLLVAGFDVYGGASHQLESRLYMDFLRMEGEFNFLLFLPPAERTKLRDYWYRGAPNSTKQHYFATTEVFQRETGIVYQTDDPKREFLETMRGKIHGATAPAYDYRQGASQEMIDAFQALEANVGSHNRFMPQVSFLNIIGEHRDEVYTILRTSAYLNIAEPFRESSRRLPEDDSLVVARGFIGAYPNNFFQINEKELPRFVREIAAMNSVEAQNRMLQRYVVHRGTPWFWRISDKFQRMHLESGGINAGIFDLNRYHHR